MEEKLKPTKPAAVEALSSGVPPGGTLEDFKIPRKEIDGSTIERLEISRMKEKVRAELESD